MKKFILVSGLFLSFFAHAEESAWKTKLRGMISNVAGIEWSNKILGEAPKEINVITLPAIPQILKKNTDVESYTKKTKAETEYDRLTKEKKRQFDFKFLHELFLVTRKSEAKDEDLANWMNTLDQGGSREGIYQALVLDDVYAALENLEEKPSKRLIDFSVLFAQKFLNQTFKPEALQSLNLYSLKRIMTEKGLDVLEFYETKDLNDLYRWYAIFSADLAKDYGAFLKSEVRKDQIQEYHYEWAKSMPIQHIKSEFIIKLHTVMNGLQLLQ
ncbi:MAG: hypothetical protein AB7I27_05310 [Bacteriovoracaceae bacterium]